MKKDYTSHRVGASLAYLLVTLRVVLRGGSAVAQLVIDYPPHRETVVVLHGGFGRYWGCLLFSFSPHFTTSGVLETTQFALNPDFQFDLSFVSGNFDADRADEVFVAGGRQAAWGAVESAVHISRLRRPAR